MGTRGLYGLCVDGTLKATYNHFDSYPAGLGGSLGDELTALLAERGLEWMRERARAIVTLDSASAKRPLTSEERARIAPLLHTDSRLLDQSLESVLREVRGSLDSALRAELMLDNANFAADSLFCEWAYVADLDRERLEIFKGFQETPHTYGRFATLEPENHRNGTIRYWPVRQFLDLPFERLVGNWTMDVDRLAQLIFYPEEAAEEESAQERLELITRLEPYIVGIEADNLQAIS